MLVAENLSEKSRKIKEKSFQHIDKDHSGRITHEEIEEGFKELAQHTDVEIPD
jgi:Ca2+-binding EF-hand superfamily protein